MSTMSAIVGILVLLVILVILLFLVKTINDTQQQAIEDNECAQSVKEYAVLKQGGGDLSDYELNCPTRKFTPDELGELKGTKEELKEQVANEMYRCWKNYGEGKLDLYSAKDKKYCAYCSYISFKDKTLELDHFIHYLTTNRIPTNEKTYYG